MLIGAEKGDALPGPQPTEQLDLLAGAAPPAGEVLAERLALDAIPAQPDAEPELATGQQADLGGLLRHQRGLPLRQDDDAGDEVQPGDRGEVAEHDQRLTEGGRDAGRAVPALVNARQAGAHEPRRRLPGSITGAAHSAGFDGLTARAGLEPLRSPAGPPVSP